MSHPQDQSSSISSTPRPRKRKIDTLHNFIDVISDGDKSRFDYMLAEMMYANNIRFETIESEYFKKLFSALRPSYRLPSVENLSTILLDQVLKSCDFKLEVSSESGVLMLGISKSIDSIPEKILAVIQTSSMQKLYAGSWEIELTEAQLFDSLETTIISDMREKVRDEYAMKLYAVVLESHFMEANVSKESDMWYFVDQRSFIDLAADALNMAEMTKSMQQLLKEFQSSFINDKIMERGGSSLLWGSLDEWKQRYKMYTLYITNVTILRQLVADREVDVGDKVTTLFDHKFETKIKDAVQLLDGLDKLSNLCDSAQTTLADITESWFELEKACQVADVDVIDFDKIFSPLMLAANYFDNNYRGHHFSDNGQRMKQLTAYLLQELDIEGLDGYTAYKRRAEPFDKLLGKDIPKWELFWDLAGHCYPKLSRFVLNLLRIPVTTFKMDFSNIPTNHLTPNSYEKLVEVHHRLRIKEELKRQET